LLQFFSEESFAALIAFIFIKESFFKLLEIRDHQKFSSDPWRYGNELDANPSCFKCVMKASSGGNATLDGTLSGPLNYSLLNETMVLILLVNIRR
jgi:hypothetical protein